MEETKKEKYQFELRKKRLRFLARLLCLLQFQHNKMVADERQGNEVFETTLPNVLTTFGLTELKEEQKQAVQFRFSSVYYLVTISYTSRNNKCIHKIIRSG